MKEFLNDDHANHPVIYQGKEYAFYIKRSGEGHCQCRTDASTTITREDEFLGMKAFLGNAKAKERVFGLEEEFTVDVKLPKEVAGLIWEVWDATDLNDASTLASSLETEKREAKIDALLVPIIKEKFELE